MNNFATQFSNFQSVLVYGNEAQRFEWTNSSKLATTKPRTCLLSK